MNRASTLSVIAAVMMAAAFAGVSPANAYRARPYVAANYYCSDGPVYDFYRSPYLGRQVPAVYLGYVYRPFYRYTAYRVFPRTYVCDGYRPHYDSWDHHW
jgi:hypothetical protein